MRTRALVWTLALVLPLVAGGVLTTPVSAGDDKAEQDVRAYRMRIEQLVHEAKKLEANGHTEEAAARRREAGKLEEKLVRLREERARAAAEGKQPSPEARRHKAILRGLGQGIEALRALGGQEELVERLVHLHARLKAGASAPAKPQAHEGEHADPLAGPERLAHRVEIMQVALHGLREAERGDAAEILERAIRSGKMVLAKRQDEEARAFLEQTPPLAQLARVLHMAAEAWAGFGHESKARLVAGLAKHYAERAAGEHAAREHAEREGGPREGEQAEREAREREHRERARAAELERLHREMQEIHRAMQEMQKRLLELMRER